MNSRRLYSRLMKYIVPYWEVFVFSLMGMIAMAATAPMIAALTVPLLDGAFVNKDTESMQLVLLAIIVLFAARGVAGYISTYAINWVSSKLVVDLRAEMFDKLLILPDCYYSSQPGGSLVARLTSDITQLTSAVIGVITVMVRDTLTVIGLLAWMLYLNWKLSVLALLMVSVILLIMRSVGERLQSVEREARQTADSITQVLKESIENHRVVRLYGGRRYETHRMGEEASRVRDFTMRQIAISALSVPLVQLATSVALVVILYLATQQAFANETTVGSLVSIVVAMLMLSAPLKRIAGVKEFQQQEFAAAESVFSLLDQAAEPDTGADTGTITIDRARGELRFEQVSFCRGSVSSGISSGAGEILDITLTIQPGETLALVGLSECDKATLVNMVPRFIRPTAGRVLLDGHDLASLTLASLRANIALVSEGATLFNDTVAANIAYGAMGRETESRITAAAQAAHAMEFIREMPQGLQTLVGERGVKLSSGQRLRVAIARALLRDSPVLIMDETLQMPDFETSHHVQAALEALMHGRTTLVIAHRLSTVERADRIVVLQKGRIAEIGDHRELLTKEGTYARLARTFV